MRCRHSLQATNARRCGGILRLIVPVLVLAQAWTVHAAWPREDFGRFSARCVAAVIDVGASQALRAEVESACACAAGGFAAQLSADSYAAFERLDPSAKATHPAAPALEKAVLACAERMGELADGRDKPLPHDLLETILKACVLRTGTAEHPSGRIGAAESPQLVRTCQCTTDGARRALTPRMLFRSMVVPTGYMRYVRDTIAAVETSCRAVILGAPPR